MTHTDRNLEKAREVVCLRSKNASIDNGTVRSLILDIAEALSLREKEVREEIAQFVERRSPYFDEAPKASYEEDVITLAQAIRQQPSGRE